MGTTTQGGSSLKRILRLNKTSTRAGFIAIVGLPNAGKSTFINKALGHKVAIVSPKAQTTRMPVRGILSTEDTQLIFVDTPGLYKGKRQLEELMLNTVQQNWQDADAVLHVVDATKGFQEMDISLLEDLKKAKKPTVLALNKVDLIKEKEELLPILQEANDLAVYEEVFPISAMKGVAVEDLVQTLGSFVPESPFLYDPETVTDLPQRYALAETTREKIFMFLQQELPYGIAVETVSIEEFDNGDLRVDQNILLDRDAHKQIVIGHKGEMLKKIGTAARKEMTKSYGRKVHTFLQVKVKTNWANSKRLLQEMGIF